MIETDDTMQAPPYSYSNKIVETKETFQNDFCTEFVFSFNIYKMKPSVSFEILFINFLFHCDFLFITKDFIVQISPFARPNYSLN